METKTMIDKTCKNLKSGSDSMQARNQGGRIPPRNFPPPWKKVLDIVWKYWT